MRFVQICALLVAAAVMAPSHAVTGGEWYAACSEAAVISLAQEQTAPPEKKLKYRECRIEAIRAWCGLNLAGDAKQIAPTLSNERMQQLNDEVGKHCPTAWDMAFVGPWLLVVNEIEKKGGLGFFERWLPASKVIRDTLLKRYPKCEQWRSQNGLFNDAKVCFEGWYRLLP